MNIISHTKTIGAYITITIYLFLSTGCETITTGPHNNVDFKNITNLEEIVGTYRNFGEGVVGGHTLYLSELIWPNEAADWHGSIREIEIQKVNNSVIRIKGMANGEEKISLLLEEGKDFTISSGQVKLKRRLSAEASGEASATALVIYTTPSLGIDSHGDGKYRESNFFAGVTMLVFPITFQQREDIRFIKIDRSEKDKGTNPNLR